MSRIIMVLGKPGTGKSTSLENLDPNDTYIIKPNMKPLPFRGSAKKYSAAAANLAITKKITELPGLIQLISQKTTKKTVIVEDYSHFFTAVTLGDTFRSRNSGNAAFARWADFGSDVYNSVVGIDPSLLRDDLTIVILHHSEIKNDGTVGSKSSGNLLDKEVVLDSHVTYLLHTTIIEADKPEDRYKFLTNTDSIHMAKTPKGCFPELLIPNDLRAVIDTIDKYELGE